MPDRQALLGGGCREIAGGAIEARWRQGVLALPQAAGAEPPASDAGEPPASDVGAPGLGCR